LELRVFISSTFTDLEDERQHLAKKIFPAIRQICRERGIEFTEIDLRWGLTEEESLLGKVVRTCLEEIDRCRPYFIGILGSRYGWVPEFHEIQRDGELLRRYPWIEDDVLEQKSLVEIEFDYGALRDPSSAQYAYFYARRTRSTRQKVFEDTSSGQSEKLTALKERIQQSGLPYEEFSGPETLGERIYDDLLEIIEQKWKPKDEITPIERERLEHESFASSRRHAYISNPLYLRALGDAARRSASVVVRAPSGTGKSALLAYWAKSIRERNRDWIVIEHYIGIGVGGDHYGLISHIISEIKDRLKISDPIPTEPDLLVSEFPSWLARLGEVKTVIVIDALNQLDERSHHLGWLPEHLPENLSIVTSTTRPEICDLLLSRKYELLELISLSKEEREAIIVRFLSEYHKALSPDQLELIATDPKSASPLFLRTMLEELRVAGNFDHLDQLIRHYISVADLDELFQRVLERLEEDYGSRTVREVMGFIWASRKGLAERELAEIMPVTRLRLSSLLMALDYHLHRRDGLLAFFHDYLRRAVEARYASSDEKQKILHSAVGRFMRLQPPSARRAEEEPWQWIEAQNLDELRITLADPDLLPYLLEKENLYRAFGYWRMLEGKYDLVAEYDRVLTLLRSGPDKNKYIQCLEAIANFYVTAAKYGVAKPLFEELITIKEELFGAQSEEAAKAIDDYGSMLLIASELDEAEQAFRKSLDIFTTLFGRESKQAIGSLANLGGVLTSKGQLAEAEEIMKKMLPLVENLYGNGHLLMAESLNSLAITYLNLGKTEEAVEMQERSLAICKQLFGEMHPLTASGFENLGVIYRALSRLDEAHEMLSLAVDTYTSLLGTSHRLTLNAMYNLAWVLSDLRRYDESVSCYQNVIAEAKRLYAPNIIFLIHSLHNLASVMRLWKGIESARPYYEECISRAATNYPEFAKDLATRWALRFAEEGRADLLDEFTNTLAAYGITLDPQEQIGAEASSTASGPS
jgi:tetratricopeptide (TPR) repeat protein